MAKKKAEIEEEKEVPGVKKPETTKERAIRLGIVKPRRVKDAEA